MAYMKQIADRKLDNDHTIDTIEKSRLGELILEDLKQASYDNEAIRREVRKEGAMAVAGKVLETRTKTSRQQWNEILEGRRDPWDREEAFTKFLSCGRNQSRRAAYMNPHELYEGLDRVQDNAEAQMQSAAKQRELQTPVIETMIETGCDWIEANIIHGAIRREEAAAD